MKSDSHAYLRTNVQIGAKFRHLKKCFCGNFVNHSKYLLIFDFQSKLFSHDSYQNKRHFAQPPKSHTALTSGFSLEQELEVRLSKITTTDVTPHAIAFVW